MKRTMILCLALSTVFSAHAIAQSGQDLSRSLHSEFLQRQVAPLPSGKITIQSALRTALSSTRVPGGIILTANCDEEREYELRPSSASLSDVLNAIAAADPAYKWKFEWGVVNLMPKGGEPPLLGLRIERFEVKKTNLHLAFQDLFNLPEVKRRRAELNIDEIHHELGLSSLKRPGTGSDENQEGFSVSCENVTVEEALNAIVRAHGYGVWAYSERHCNGKDYVRLDFIAR